MNRLRVSCNGKATVDAGIADPACCDECGELIPVPQRDATTHALQPKIRVQG